MAGCLKFYQTWQATEELYFSHIEVELDDFSETKSGTKTIQRRKQIEATKGFNKLWFLFCLDKLSWFLNLPAPLMEFRLGLNEEATIAQ